MNDGNYGNYIMIRSVVMLGIVLLFIIIAVILLAFDQKILNRSPKAYKKLYPSFKFLAVSTVVIVSFCGFVWMYLKSELLYSVIAAAIGALFGALYISIYYVPYFIAKGKNHSQKRVIYLLNIFAGWTVVAWIAALIWSCIEPQDISINRPVQSNAAQEILRYKELLDCGAITQEEYNAKKKQLLG